MKLLEAQNRINELMSLFVTRVKGFTAMSRTDINQVAETVLIPLLAEVYGYKSLKNLNYTDQENYPGIDLGDQTAKVAFQITSTSESTKIKHTLKQFVDYELYKKYDRLIIYIITEKQKSYSGRGYQDIIQGKFNFNQDKDILDYKDILKEITNFQINKIVRIKAILENNFGEGKKIFLLNPLTDQPEEDVYLNLLKINFPEQLYIAELKINREQIIKNSQNRDYVYKLNTISATRKVIRAAIEQQNLKFGLDWKDFQNKIITFYDLTDKSLPLYQVIDSNTIQSISSYDFYQHSPEQEKIFKSLLNFCLQNQLKTLKIDW